MRDRLLLAFTALSLLTLALYGVPRAFIIAEDVRDAEQRQVTRLAAAAASLVDARLEAGLPVTPEVVDDGIGDADQLVYRDGDREVVGGLTELDEGGAVSATAAVPAGGEVVLTRSGERVDQRVAEAVLPIVVIGLAVLLVTMAAAVWLARRLARPFQRLAASADQLGTGRFDEVEVGDERLPEARAIATALRRSSDRLATLVARERQFAANVSHQLRTPLTAVRLRLEDLTYWDEVDPQVAAELRDTLVEIDRLADTITDLLAVARTTDLGTQTAVDLRAVVDEVAQRWEPLVRATGRRLQVFVRSDADERVPTAPGAVQQVLDVLLDNGLKHGRGTLTVELDPVADHVRFRVGDQGPGITADAAARVFERRASGVGSDGEGIGLALASELARSIGGRLVLVPGAPTRFDLLLPRI
ncbi:HAMP domain-containing histidine kinase [Nitriliruptoraceae bacterium ZYF776]|nr:HAMP domain-containing histidine kinase [Profundirhabdus halotolerans]